MSEKLVQVAVTGRFNVLTMTLERAYEKFVQGFFPNVTQDDVWVAAQTRNGWEGSVSGAIVSIIKADKVRDSDAVLR